MILEGNDQVFTSLAYWNNLTAAIPAINPVIAYLNTRFLNRPCTLSTNSCMESVSFIGIVLNNLIYTISIGYIVSCRAES